MRGERGRGERRVEYILMEHPCCKLEVCAACDDPPTCTYFR